jgi:hypothetical protein
MGNEIVSYKLKLPAQWKTCGRKTTDRIPHTDMLMGRLLANKKDYVENYEKMERQFGLNVTNFIRGR